MRAMLVVMDGMAIQDGNQVPWPDDEYPVGHLGPDGTDPALGIGIRSRAARRDLHCLDPRAGKHRVECFGELPGPVPDQKSEPGGAFSQVHEQVPGLLGGPGAVRVRGHAEDITWRVPTSITKKT